MCLLKLPFVHFQNDQSIKINITLMIFNCDFILVKNNFKTKNQKMFLITFFLFFFYFLKFLPTSPVIQTHNLLRHKEIPTEGRVSTSVVQKTPFQRWQQEANKAEALKRLLDDINSTEDSVHEYRSLCSISIKSDYRKKNGSFPPCIEKFKGLSLYKIKQTTRPL